MSEDKRKGRSGEQRRGQDTECDESWLAGLGSFDNQHLNILLGNDLFSHGVPSWYAEKQLLFLALATR